MQRLARICGEQELCPVTTGHAFDGGGGRPEHLGIATADGLCPVAYVVQKFSRGIGAGRLGTDQREVMKGGQVQCAPFAQDVTRKAPVSVVDQ